MLIDTPIGARRKPRLLYWTVLLIASALSLLPSRALAQPCDERYYTHRRLATYDDINRTHLSSLLAVEADDQFRGVAFLIDRRAGLYLTAAHVLAEAIGVDEKDLRTNPSKPQEIVRRVKGRW